MNDQKGGNKLLLSLHVKNLAIIDEVEVFFTDKLNILTGETGAGKSIIIGSINIALGAKVSKEIIRKGADYALVELVFQLDDRASIDAIKELDLPIEDGQIIISRKIMNTRSIFKVNGENVTASTLKVISSILIDIHGQHEHQSLLYKNKHLQILDHFSKEEIGELKKELEDCYKRFSKAKKKLNEVTIDEDKKLREISFLEYEINEIKSARLKEHEDEELAIQYKKLSNMSTITNVLSTVYNMTGSYENNSAGDNIARAMKSITRIDNMDDELGSFVYQLSEIENLLNDFNRELSDYIEGLTFSQEDFKQIEDRLNLINNLKAKYGNSMNEIHEYCKASEEKLLRYQNYEYYVDSIKKELIESESELNKKSEELSKIRQENAIVLTKLIKDALIDLNFLDVKFDMIFKKLGHFTENGIDEAEFIISTNPGEEQKPLSKVASGGELSRIMLAIKSVLADNDSIDTLIFDEIDVGVSGRTAQRVSEKLSVIAKNHQVLCITHLPQIAAMADSHFIIEKNTDGDTTHTTIRALKEEESVEEIARILGGAKITETVITSAREMKELAQGTKIY